MAMLAEYAQGDHPRIRGENARLPPYKRRKPDHPRIRGENSEQTGQHWVFEGSPPHTRGKWVYPASQTSYQGITPAYAGKINVLFSEEICAPDHPRIRGENPKPKRARQATLGSPPHTRGKLTQPQPGQDAFRITPAYAGKISPQAGSCRRCWDHPRIRGENASVPYYVQQRAGSPPHTRGKLPRPR